MDPIIRAADVASARRLPRAGVVNGTSAPIVGVSPLAQVPAVATCVAVRPDAPATQDWAALASRAESLAGAEDALRLRLAEMDEQERLLRQREMVLAARERAVEEELERRREVAEQRGLVDGAHKLQAQLEILQQEAQSQAAAQNKQLQAVLGALRDSRAGVLDGADELLVEVVHGALCRLLGDGVALRAAVAATVAGVLREVRDGEPVRVYVHQQDLALLAGLADAGGDARLQLLADGRVAVGGCLVETARGTLDARLELQLQQLRDALLAVRQSHTVVPVVD